MKISTRLNQFAIAAIASITLLGISQTSIAATQNNTQAKPQIKMPKDAKHIQDFEKAGINVQFRYVGGKLAAIRFKNVSVDAIHLAVLKNNYVLGPGDSLVLEPPHIKFIYVKHKPHHVIETSADAVLKDRYTTSSIYKLPPHME